MNHAHEFHKNLSIIFRRAIQVMKKILFISVLLIILLIIPLTSHASSPFKQNFFDGKLFMSNVPLVSQKATITLNLTAISGDCDITTIKFNAPDGISVLGRSVFEDQSFIKGLSRQYSVEIEVLEEETYAIQASVYFQHGVEHFFTYLITGKTNSQLTDKVNSLTISKNAIQTLHSLLAPPKTQETLSLSGYITYYDDNLSKYIPIQKLTVQLFEVKTNSMSLLATTNTDNDGMYSFNVPNDTMRDLQMRLIFDNDIIRLLDNNNNTYSLDLPVIHNVSAGTISDDYFINSSNQYRGLGNIFNTIVDAYDFLQSNLNWSRQKLNAKWPYQGDNLFYTYLYRLNGNISNEIINIPIDGQWKRTSILHEYGHSVMTALYGYNYNNLPKENFNGEPDADFAHFINTVSDTGFAMKEGWAEYFEALVDDNAFSTTEYNNADTPNIEYNNWWKGRNGNNTDGSIVEGIVASILWDITDTVNSKDEVPNLDDDNISGNIKNIWNLISKYRPKSIVEFWNYWIDNIYDQVEALYSIYSNNHVKVIPTWDINEDGKTDFSDMTLASSHFGQNISSPIQSNPDVNRDGQVNIIDLVIISRKITQ
jgi:hypothetical protein